MTKNIPKCSFFSTLLPRLVSFFTNGHSERCEMTTHCDFNLGFLMIGGVEHFSYICGLFALFFCQNVYYQVTSLFFHLIVFLLLFVFLDINTLYINGLQVFYPNLWAASSHFIVFCAGRDFQYDAIPFFALLSVLLGSHPEFLTDKPAGSTGKQLSLHKLNRGLPMVLCSSYTEKSVFHFST